MNNAFIKLLQLTEMKEKEMLVILDQTIEQRAELLNDNIDEMNEIADFKQIQIDIINEIDVEYEKEHQELFKTEKNVQSLVGIEKEYFEQLQIKRSSVAQIIEKISLLESENKTNLLNKMVEVKKQISQVKTGKKGLNAYFQSGVAGSSYIDQKK